MTVVDVWGFIDNQITIYALIPCLSPSLLGHSFEMTVVDVWGFIDNQITIYALIPCLSPSLLGHFD
jgi:hypothetical protein